MDIDGAVGRGYARSAMEIKTRRWKRIEYQRLIEAGCFEAGERVELVGGQLIVAEPQASGHFAAIRAVEEALRAVFGPGWEVRGQGPLALDEESEPEPDIGLLRPRADRYATGSARAEDVLLLIEVADTSYRYDSRVKLPLYARAGVAETWIVDLGRMRHDA